MRQINFQRSFLQKKI